MLPLITSVLMTAATLPAVGCTTLADTADNESLISNEKQLITEGKRSGEGYFSADGKTMIFQAEMEAENPFFQIYTIDMASGDIELVSPGIGKTTCSWIHPTNGSMLYASTHLDPEAEDKMQAELDFRASGETRRYAWDYDDTMDIFVKNADGNVTQMTDTPGYDAEGSFSPDGTQIVFTSFRTGFPAEGRTEAEQARFEKDAATFGEIFIMNADGTNVRQLTDTPGYDGGPFFSPDGQRIIWRRFDEAGQTADVYTMTLDGSDVKRLTDFGSVSWAPFIHPSGDYVIFASNKLGFRNFELFLVDIDGEKEPVQVTFTEGFDGLASFTPDGNQMTWTSGRTDDGTSQIFLADWDHEAALKALEEAPARGEAESE